MPDPATPKTQPNILWVFGDQHRAQACGYRGDPHVCTPNIDRLANDGIRFDNAVAGSPWCCPFRGALLTGLYPHQNGVTQTPAPLDPAIPTIATPFKQAGYHTAYVGKWHLDGSNQDHVIPPDRRGGFDHWVAYENYNEHFDSKVHGSGIDTPQPLGAYETDALTSRFIDHLEQHFTSQSKPQNTQPFFGVLSVTPPHNPYIAPEQDVARHAPGDVELRPNVPQIDWVRERARKDLAGYHAMIENLDQNVGRLRDALTRLGIERDTIIMFFSDHGDMHGSHGQFGKSTPYEESIRIPLIVASSPDANLTRTESCDAPVNHVDLYATTLGLAGITPPPKAAGFDYAHRILPQSHPNHRAIDPSDEPTSAFCQQIVAKHHPHSVNRPWRAVVTRDGWKYVAMPGQDWLMHDLNTDPYEQMNLAYDDVYKDRRLELLNELKHWITNTGDSFDLPNL